MSEIPAHIQPYVDVLGEDGAIDFLLKFGGAPVHLTEKPRVTSSVVAAVGMEQARKLGRRFGAGYQRVPTAKPWIAKVLKDRGVAVLAIARRLHVTDATVRSYLRTEPRQLSLF